MAVSVKPSEFLAICCVSAFAILALSYIHAQDDKFPSDPIPDGYESRALGLYHFGVITAKLDGNPRPSTRRPPTYILFLNGILHVDSTYRDYLNCYYEFPEGRDHECSFGLKTQIIHNLPLLLMVVSIFFTSRVLGAGKFVSLFLSLAGLVMYYETLGKHRFSEGVSIPLLALMTFSLAVYIKKRQSFFWLSLMSVVLAALILSRDVYIFLAPIMALSVFFICRTQYRFSESLKRSGALLLIVGLVMAPWLLRNALIAGHAAESYDRTPNVMAMRAEYTTITPDEALAGLVHFLPAFGDDLARNLFGEASVKRFNLSNPSGFRILGREKNLEIHDTGLGGSFYYFGVFFENFDGYVLSMGPLGVRGSKNVLYLYPFCLVAVWLWLKEKKYIEFWILAPTVFIFVFHVALTNFRSRYGAPMVTGLTPLAAVGLSYLVARVRSVFDARRQMAAR